MYNVVHRLGGEIEVASRKHKGTVFSVYFPLSLPPLAPKPHQVTHQLERTSAYLIRAEADYDFKQTQQRQARTPKPESHPGRLAVPTQPSRPTNGERTVSTATSDCSTDDREETTRQRSTLIVEDDPVNAK